MNKKIVLATGVKADETDVQGTTTAGTETSGVTASNSGRLGEEKNETASTDKQPVTENSDGEAGSQSEDPNKSGVATNDDDV